MNTQSNQPSVLTLLIMGIVVIGFGAAGFARIVGWAPMSAGGSGGNFASAAPNGARAGPRCPECGRIVSMRAVDRGGQGAGPGSAGGAAAGGQDAPQLNSSGSVEIIVRMADGSTRVINDPEPARWRTGERLIVIDGFSPSTQ